MENTVIGKYIVSLLFIIYLIWTLVQSSNDSKSLTSKYNNYIFPLVIGLSILIPSVFLGKESMSNLYYTGLIIGTILAVFGSVLYFYFTAADSTYSIFNYLLSGIITLGFFVGLAIIFYFYSHYLKRSEGWVGFFVHLIFYIPCLIIDFYNYIKREFELTTNVVYYLFMTEIALILLYKYVPILISKVSLKQSIPLLKDTVFLDIENPIATSYDLRFTQETDDPNSPIVYRNNYSLSMWIMVNNHSENTIAYAKETPIFNYGNGVPKITYKKKTEFDAKDTLHIYFTNVGVDKGYTVEIDTQKWNQFVFNYRSDSADLFVNGVLEKTFSFNIKMLPKYSPDDLIVVGSTDGIDGAICNVEYYIGNQTRAQIANSYNLLVKQNPPTNIL